MANQLEQQASQILQAIQDATPQVTEALVQLTYAQGVSKIVIAVLAFLVLIAAQVMFWRGLLAFNVKRELTESEGNGYGFKFVFGGLFSLISLFVAGAHLADGVIYLVAPEGKTIMNVIQAMRGALQ